MSRPRRLRFAFPLAAATGPDCVHLVGGEDLRYTLRGPELDRWILPLLEKLAGGASDAELLEGLPADRQQAARELLDRLAGERVLLSEPAPAPQARAWCFDVEGEGGLAERVRAALADRDRESGEPLVVLCQDTLDYRTARDRSRELRRLGRAELWVSTGAAARAFVSPLFLPESSPCFDCLLSHLLRLSRAPDLTGALIDTGLQPLAKEGSGFPRGALALLAELVAHKCALALEPEPPAALFRLHAFELATLETSSHPVSPDPECSICP
jgi:bacteriocin biosynthesis cyclodehydratase domain-containing protein